MNLIDRREWGADNASFHITCMNLHDDAASSRTCYASSMMMSIKSGGVLRSVYSPPILIWKS